MTTYTQNFYVERNRLTRYAADKILGLALTQIPHVSSALDIGCGVGTWLSVLKERFGVGYVTGYDGPWVDPALLRISQCEFSEIDIEQGLPPISRRYDLAISLEVAEHLSPARGAELVTFLTESSDHVLFSAAIPGQGGTGHLNEQWPAYWADLFHARGYGALDTLRGQIWNDTQIPVWYRQNPLLFVRGVPMVSPLPLVHPDLYLAYADPGVLGSFKTLRRSIRQYVRGAV